MQSSTFTCGWCTDGLHEKCRPSITVYARDSKKDKPLQRTYECACSKGGHE